MPLIMKTSTTTASSKRAAKSPSGPARKCWAVRGRLHLHRRRNRDARRAGRDGSLLRPAGARPPGSDPENVAPATVEARHSRMRPRRHDRPADGAATGGSTRSSWRGTAAFQAARAVEYSLPFLAKASNGVTLLVVGTKADDVGASYLARNLGRHGIKHLTIDAIDPGAVSGRGARPRPARLHARQGIRPAGEWVPTVAARC